MATKCTTAQTLERKKKIRELLLDRWSTGDIVSFCKENYNIGRNRTEKLIMQINGELREVASQDQQRFYQLNVETLQDIIIRNIGEEDMTAIHAIKELNKMTGNAVTKTDITTNGEPLTLVVSPDFVPKNDKE